MPDLEVTSARIPGTALRLTLGGDDYWADCTSAVLDNEDANADVVTFYDAANGGGRQFFFTIGAVQSVAGGSFWSYVWDNTGEEVAYVYAPHGNEAATADQPQFTGTLKIGAKPTLGGDAGIDVDQVFETRFDVVGVPEIDRGA